MKVIKTHSIAEFDKKLEEWVEENVYEDGEKYREDKGFYKGFPSVSILRGHTTVCIAYIVP